MEIKFIVNEKSYSTLCKTVKTADLFSVELSDNYGYTAYVVVDNVKHMVYLTNINGIDCHREQRFADYGKTEKGFKINLFNFFVRIIHHSEEEFHLISEENVLFHLYKNICGSSSSEQTDETSSSSEQTEEEVSSSDEVSEMEEKYISSATTLSIYSEKGVSIKGYADRIEVELNFNTICKFQRHIFAHDLAYIRYADKKWRFSSDEKNLTIELLHKLIELYDDGITPDEVWVNGKLFSPIEFIDFLYMKEKYFILTGLCSYEKGFFHVYHGYTTKKLLIDTNKSNVFNKWKYIAPISKADFLDSIKWICEDKSPDEKCYTKAIALTPNGIIKLTATHSVTGYNFFDENGKKFSGAYFKRKAVTDKEKLFADENGEISSFCKIILSSKDRV